MKKLLIFLKKELVESFKTSKFIILMAVFGFFALLSPASAKYINEIIGLAGGGIEINFPEPTYVDSFVQIFKNLNSICLLALIITYAGSISSEKSKNTIYLVLSKGLSRRDFYAAKFVSALIMFTSVYIISSLMALLYTLLLFGSFDMTGIVLSFFLFWLYGLLMLSITLFFSNMAKTTTSGTVYSILVYFLLSILSQFKAISNYLPSKINELSLKVIGNESVVVDNIHIVIITGVLIIALNVIGSEMLKRQEL